MKYYLIMLILFFSALSCNRVKEATFIERDKSMANTYENCIHSDTNNYKHIKLYTAYSPDDLIQSIKRSNFEVNGEWGLRVKNYKKIKSVENLNLAQIDSIKNYASRNHSCAVIILCQDTTSKKNYDDTNWDYKFDFEENLLMCVGLCDVDYN